MDYFSGDYSEFCPLENLNVTDNVNGVTNFTVDDLLDLSKDDDPMAEAFFDNTAVNSDGSSTLTVVDSCNSSVSGGDGSQFNGNLSCSSFNDNQFSGNELCVPYDDLAELEWLSNFVEESFSNDDVHHFIPTTAAAYSSSSASAVTSGAPSFFPAEVSVPGKARSKLSRAPPRDWSSRLLHLSPFSSSKTGPMKKKEPTEITGRKCLHCGSDKTPQWRTGPMGPKTLCNACGVRYKSGRLVPEYRPAASPSFISSKHSNSHRKVMELRRQKDYQRHQHQQLLGQVSIFNRHDEFMIHHRGSFNGSDYSHMM